MKTIYFPAVVVATLLFSPIFQFAWAEGPQRVALLDVGRVFKQHIAFNKAMEGIQQEVEVYKGQIQEKQGQIRTKAEALRSMEPNSAQATALEATLTKMTADLQVEHQLKNKEFIQLEAQLYFNTYMDVSAKVSTFCEANNISLVLRHVAPPLTEDRHPTLSRQSILERVNNPIVFARNRDITDAIIQQTNAGVQQATRPIGQQR